MKSILLLILITFSFTVNSATIVVTNTNDSGAGSFRQAVADANMGDIIRFDPSLISAGSDTIIFATPVNITKGLFIKGVYNNIDTLYFSGDNLSRMIDINMSSTSTFGNVDIDSLVFINGYASSGGGALNYTSDYNPDARLYLRHCVFRDNNAPTGGAIYSYKTSGGTGSNYTCNITMEYSTFKNNMSSYSGAGNGGGGAISIYRYSSTIGYAVGIDLAITGCNFLNNTTAARGGAIYAYVYAYAPPSTGISNIDVTSSSFIGNEATHYGGALYSYSFGNTRCEAHSTTSTWAGNTTVGSGGACYLESVSKSTLFDASFSTFYGNMAFVDGSALYLKSIDTDNSYTSRIESYSSIFAANAGNVNYQNTIYQSASSTLNSPFSSSCYNLFDFPQNHLLYYQEYFPDASDNFNQTLGQLNLAALALNANGTYTMVPNEGSVAIGTGPGTGGEAQNGPVLGIRDIGAAESDICLPISVSETASFCQGSFYNFYDQVLSAGGTYSHTIVTPNQCDSIVTLTLTATAPVSPTISISANPGNTIMVGTPVTITATITNGGTSPSYQWYANGSPIGPNAASVISSTLTNGVQVKCIVTSNDVCVSPATAQSNIITFTVHANNDEPCNAINLATNTTCVSSYFANHIATETTNVGAHSCASSSSNDIWFKFVAPPSGIVNIFTYSGTLTDAVMSVYLGTNCSSLFEVGCVDDDGTNQMPQGFVSGATPGTTYYIRVSSFGTTAVGNFAICLVEENSQPTSINDEVNTAYNTSVTIPVLANDSDMGGSLDLSSLTISNPSVNGTAVVNGNGTITFTPNSGVSGVTTFQYQICDDGTPALCTTATVTVTVSPDSNPVANNDVVSTPYFTAITIDVLTNDFDLVGNLVLSSLSIFVQSINGTAVANGNGTITFTPNNGFSGVTTFQYQICDNEVPALCTTATVTITVGSNSTPVANNDVSSTDFSSPITIDVLTNDSDADGNLLTTTVTISTQSANGTAIPNTNGTITFTPTDGFSGLTTFEYQVCDGGIPALCATATVTVNVGVNSISEQTIFSAIYPNPASKTLTVKTNGKLSRLKILSLEGKLLSEHTIFENINIEELSAGVYFIELVFENEKVSREQFVKE
ncbi:MAG: Ig-like domain-containing protein [Bacteroidota bacterium]